MDGYTHDNGMIIQVEQGSRYKIHSTSLIQPLPSYRHTSDAFAPENFENIVGVGDI